MNQELCKQYLGGSLSSSEMYQVEHRLLENDFYFEAMEGLEQMSWDRCEKACQEVEAQIMDRFGIKKGYSGNAIRVVLSIMLLTALGWGINSVVQGRFIDNQTVDLTVDQEQVASSPLNKEMNSSKTAGPGAGEITNAGQGEPEPNDPNRQQVADNAVDPAASAVVPAKEPEVSKQETKEKRPPPPTENTAREPVVRGKIQIAVGRIVDSKGIALQNVLVQAVADSDSTDKSGYYALKIPEGTFEVRISHLGFEDRIELNTSQSWEIVLDLVDGQVIEYHPINAANRFK